MPSNTPPPQRWPTRCSPDDIVAAEHRLGAAEAELRSLEAQIESLRTRAATRLASLDGADREALDQAVAEASAALTAARADADARAELAGRLQVVVAEPSRCTAPRVVGTVARLEAVAATRDDLAAAEAGAHEPPRGPARRARRLPLRLPRPGRARAGRAGRSPTTRRPSPTSAVPTDRLASVTTDLDAALESAGFDDAETRPGGPGRSRPSWPACGPR